MIQPNQPTDHLTGVWIGPRNTRIDITRDGEQWVASAAIDRRGMLRPGAPVAFTDPDQLRAGIARLVDQGYVRQPAAQPVAGTEDGERTWSFASMIGALILGLLIVAVGIAIIS